MKHEWDPARLPVRAFARAAAQLRGERALADWPRLSQDAVDSHGWVRWALQGHTRSVTGGADQIWLVLHASAEVALSCQRCLGPVRCPLTVERAFRFVADEAQAAQEDETSEEDVLVWSERLDALALLEDELIMALPMIPMHATCQGEHVLTSKESDADVDADRRPNPFAVLSQWRGGKSNQ